MEFTVTRTEADLAEVLDAQNRAVRRKPTLWLGMGFLALLALYPFLLVYLLAVRGHPVVAALVLPVAATSIVHFPWTATGVRRSKVRAMVAGGNPVLLGPVAYLLDESGLSWRYPFGYSAYQWEAFGSYMETPGLFIVFMQSTHVTILPKRAFASEADIQAARQIFAARIGTVYPRVRKIAPAPSAG
jgi:hypothetical protein